MCTAYSKRRAPHTHNNIENYIHQEHADGMDMAC